MRLKFAKIQTSMKKKLQELAILSKRIESVAVRNKAADEEEVDRLKVVVAELDKEIERMSPLEPRIRLEELRLIDPTESKKGKENVGASKSEDAQTSELLSA